MIWWISQFRIKVLIVVLDKQEDDFLISNKRLHDHKIVSAKELNTATKLYLRNGLGVTSVPFFLMIL